MAITTVPAITAKVAREGTGKLKPLPLLFCGFSFLVLTRFWLNWLINPVLKPADLLLGPEEFILRLLDIRCFSIIVAILGLSTKNAIGIIYDMMKGTKPILLAIAAALVLKLFFFDFIVAHGHSMEPAIQDGNVLVVSRLRYGMRLPLRQKYLIHWAQPKVGEVVVFYTPTGELAVKRCMAVEGQFFYAEGDNGLASYDSRAYGMVPVGNIIGKVLGY